MFRAGSPIAAILFFAVACGGAPEEVTAPLAELDVVVTASPPTDAQSFVAPASGDQEVPPRDTRARGTAIFHVNEDGTELHFKLIVANITNVVQSHIHLAPFGVNGGIVVFLYGPVPPGGGRVDGVISEGHITAADLIGSLAGQPLSALLAEIVAGNAYVNVHTLDGVNPPNSGPGNFPGGEVRGQIKGGHVSH
jgi:CHRD domain